MYPEDMVKPMRDELVRIGFNELKTAEEVDSVLGQNSGTVLCVVNSVCGCAAGGARPGVALALKNGKLPTKLTTVFAGVDREATEKARGYFRGYPPSSPSMALFKDGKVVYMLERKDIEGHTPAQIAENLKKGFDQHCG